MFKLTGLDNTHFIHSRIFLYFACLLYLVWLDIDACPGHQCLNGATCVDLPELDAYNCTCVTGFTGSTVRQVSTKRNLTATQISIWCKLFTSLFQNIEIVAWWQTADMFVSCSTCIITFYVYLSDIDACPDYQCQNNATYVDLPEAGAYNCSCAAGYTGLLCETGRHCFWYTVFCKHRNQWSRFYFSWNVS